MNQSLFDFGRTRKAVTQSRVGHDLSETDLEKTRQDVIFRVIKSYFETLLAQEMVRVAEEWGKECGGRPGEGRGFIQGRFGCRVRPAERSGSSSGPIRRTGKGPEPAQPGFLQLEF